MTPALFEHARRHAADAGVEVEWIEGDAQELPFADASFDRVISTFAAMFAPDHAGAAAELVRVCRPRRARADDDLDQRRLCRRDVQAHRPVPAASAARCGAAAAVGGEAHVREMFTAAGVSPGISRELVVFDFPSVEDAVREYTDAFGPFVMARSALKPQGRWDEFVAAFRDLVTCFNPEDDRAEIDSAYFLITADR